MTLDEIKDAIGVKPYYEEPMGVIYNADCLDILPKIPEKSIDLVLTDPPYGVYLGMVDNGQSRDKNQQPYTDFDDTPKYVKEICVPIIKNCISISKRVILTPGNRNMWLYPQPNDCGVWYNPAGTSRGKWGFQLSQPILYYGKDPRAGRGSTASSCWGHHDKVTHIRNSGHPCPKPYTFIRWLLNKGSKDKDDLILDPFLGSGTTAVAAKQLSRQYIGIEISKKYCDIAVQRLAQEILI